MLKKQKKPKYSKEQIIPFVKEYYGEQLRFKKEQERFETLKKLFYCDMEELFNYEGIDKLVVESNDLDGEDLVVNKVQKTSINFDVDKLENRLGKKFSKEIIEKQYTITDFNRLVIYLRSCGVDHKVFKSFLSVTKTVDTKKLDKLADFGYINKDDLADCYEVTRNKPYFTVRVKRGRRNDRTKAITEKKE